MHDNRKGNSWLHESNWYLNESELRVELHYEVRTNQIQCSTSIIDPLFIVIMWRFQINVTLAEIDNLEF